MLNRRMFEFDLDIRKICNNNALKIGCVKQLDGTTFIINLFNNERPMNLDDCVIRLFAKAEGKEGVFQKEGIEVIDKNTISIRVVDEIFENVGDVIFEVEIVDLDGYIETTPEFIVNVIDKIGDDSNREIIRIQEVSMLEELKGYLEESIANVDRYKELLEELSDGDTNSLLEEIISAQDTVMKMAPLIAEETKRLGGIIEQTATLQLDLFNSERDRTVAEKFRLTNEEARLEAEKLRNSREETRVIREESRVLMEGQRSTSEVERVLAEDERVSNEEDRIFNEEERIEAEDERRWSEEERVDMESERIEAENERLTAEVERVENEETRETHYQRAIVEENKRVSNEINRVSREEDRVEAEKIRVLNEEIRIKNEARREETEVLRLANDVVRESTVKEIKEDMELVHEKVDNLQFDTKFETSIVIKGNVYPTTDGKMPVHFGPPTKDGGNVIMPYARTIGGMTKDGSGVRTIGFIAKPKDANKDLDITEEMNSDAVFLGTNVSQLFLYSKERYPTIVSEGELSPLATQDWVMRLVSGLGLLEGVGDTVVAETSSVPSVFFDKKFSDEWSSVPGNWMISDEQKAVMLPDGVKDLYKPLIARDRFNEISYVKGGSLENSQSDIFVGLWKTTNYIYGFRMMKNTLSISYFGTNGSRGGAVTFTIREAINPGDIVTLHYNFINDIWEIYKFDDNNEPILVYQMSKFIMSGFPEFGSGKQVVPTLSILVNEIGGFQLTDCPNPGPIRDHGTINEYIF